MKVSGCAAVNCAVKVPGTYRSSSASRPRAASSRCQKFQYQAPCARYWPAVTFRRQGREAPAARTLTLSPSSRASNGRSPRPWP